MIKLVEREDNNSLMIAKTLDYNLKTKFCIIIFRGPSEQKPNSSDNRPIFVNFHLLDVNFKSKTFSFATKF